MEKHPSYPVLSTLLTKYPRSASSLFQAYNDIVYAQQWTEVKVLNLESCARGAITGKKKNTDKTLHVVPCSLSETLSFSWLQNAFAELFPPSPPRMPPSFITSSVRASSNPQFRKEMWSEEFSDDPPQFHSTMIDDPWYGNWARNWPPQSGVLVKWS